jgi:adenosylcobinamide-phosphate synthase
MSAMSNYIIVAIVLAYITDLLLGDPSWLPHPVVGMGKMIAWGEKRLNKGRYLFFKGVLLSIVYVLGLAGLTWWLLLWSASVSPWLTAAFVYITVFFLLANHTLIREGYMVFDVLDSKGLEAGRQKLSRIVGRDTSQLSTQQIRTAVLETMSENLSDGVVAPLFWLMVAGLPGMVAYKMINTLDSMIGYKNDRYILFGRFAARLDDVANFIPARLTAILMVVVGRRRRGLKFLIKYSRNHSSPNSGYPEAALAGILNVRFGGPNIYHGQIVQKPYIGDNPREIDRADFRSTALINHVICLIMILLVVFFQMSVWHWPL